MSTICARLSFGPGGSVIRVFFVFNTGAAVSLSSVRTGGAVL